MDDLDGGLAYATGVQSVLRDPELLVERRVGEAEAARVLMNWIRGSLNTDIRDHEIRVTPRPRPWSTPWRPPASPH